MMKPFEEVLEQKFLLAYLYLLLCCPSTLSSPLPLLPQSVCYGVLALSPIWEAVRFAVGLFSWLPDDRSRGANRVIQRGDLSMTILNTFLTTLRDYQRLAFQLV